MPAIIHPISERWLHIAMVHQKRRHLHAVGLVNYAFMDVMCPDVRSRPRVSKLAAYFSVVPIRLPQARHHLPRSVRPPDFQRLGAVENPSRQPPVGNAYRMIGMQMRQE